MGFRGRAAIHPVQLPVIAAAYHPTEEEIAAALEVVSAADQGAVALADGRFVDEAVVRQARRVLADAAWALRLVPNRPGPGGVTALRPAPGSVGSGHGQLPMSLSAEARTTLVLARPRALTVT